MQLKLWTILSVVVLTWLSIPMKLDQASVIPKRALLLISSPTTFPSSSSTSTSTIQTTNSIDPTILAALIGLIGIIVGALIAGGFAIYQLRRTALLEKQRQEDQRRYEQQRQNDQFRHDQEMAQLQKVLEQQYRTKDQEEQLEATKAEELRQLMLLDQTNTERTKTYRRALHADPRISHLQILDMSRPLEVNNVYVRVRVHKDTRLGYELDPATRVAEAQRDPNALLKASLKFLEHRVSSAINPDEAIRIFKRCVIVGDPGAGKTTLLKYLTLKAADGLLIGLPDIPIRVELNAFAISEYHDLLDFAAAEWDQSYGFPKQAALAYMEERLIAGNALLLLDALDESVVGDTAEVAETSYNRVSDAIVQASTRYHQSFIVVTARKAGYHQRALLKGFTELEILDFRPEEMQQFVSNWFDSYHEPQKRALAADLNTKLECNPRIRALASNPLLLSLIILVYEAQLDLPDRRAELYKRCVDTLLTEWDAKRNIRRRREFKPEHKLQLLAEIAWHFHIQGKRYFPEYEVLKVIEGFLPKVRLLPEQSSQVLAEIANENGLLKEQARGWQGFLHLTLQEYFVAQYVTNHQQLDELLAHRGDPWWEEVLLLYAGLTHDASALLHKLLGYEDKKQLQEDLFYNNLILAGRCLAARPTIQQASFWETVTNLLFDTLTTTPYSLTKQHIAEVLATIGGLEVNKRLLQLLSDKRIDKDLRRYISLALGSSGERLVEPDLIFLLFDRQVDESIRASITTALNNLSERSVAHELTQMLSDERIPGDVRQQIVLTVSNLGEHSVAHELTQMLSDERIPGDVRVSIASALGNLGEHSVALELVQMLSNGQISQDVRVSIASALGNLGEQSVVSDLMQMLSNDQISQDVRVSIVSALGRLSEHSIAPELVQMLSNEKLPKEVRQQIALTVGNLGEQSVVSDLVQMLSNKKISWPVQQYIALALGSLGEHSIVPRLVQLLSSKQTTWSVRLGIAVALGNLGEHSVAPELVRLLSYKQIDEPLKRRIVIALGNLGEHSVAPELVRLLSKQQIDEVVRQHIALALNSLGEHSVASDLVRLLSNEQIPRSVRQNIALSLGNIGHRSVVRKLMQLLSNNRIDLSVRQSIAEALGECVNDEMVIRNLVALLKTPDITDSVHHALWITSRRVGVRILINEGKQPIIVRW